MPNVLVSPLVSLLVTLSSGVDAPSPGAMPALAPIGERRAVLFDRDAEGTLFAKGATYKMVFGASGAQYIPALGERAPRNMPLSFLLPGSGPIERDGDRVTIDRGSVVEVYDLGPREVEQSFVLRERTGVGELSFRVGLETELERVDVEDGLEFRAPGLGVVRYGDATIVDASGRSVTAKSELEPDGIVIRVPATFLATATYPVTIDPIITSGGIDAGFGATFGEPDAAYYPDPSFAFMEFAVVHTEFTSASDRDVVVERFKMDFSSNGESPIDISTKDSFGPAVAASTQNFLVVWTDAGGVFSGSSVMARPMSSVGTLSPTVTVAAGSALSGFDQPDVGGGGSTAVGSFVVVYRGTAGADDVLTRPVSQSGVLGAEHNVTSGLGPIDQDAPSISPTDTTGGAFLIAWREGGGGAGSQLFSKIANGQGVTSGLVTPTPVSGVSVGALGAPTVAGNGVEYAVFWTQEVSGGNHDVFAKRRSDPPFSTINGPIVNLTQAEPGTSPLFSETNVAATYDGSRFVYAYQAKSPFLPTTEVVMASALLPALPTDPLFFFEGSVAVPPSLAGSEAAPTVAGAFRDNALGRSIIAFSRDNLGVSTLDGALYDSLKPGGVSSVATGCDGLGLSVSPLSPPAIGNANFSLNVGPLGVGGQLMIGTPFPAPIPLCAGQGASCALGVNPVLFLPLASSVVVLPIPPIPTLLGVTVGMETLTSTGLLPGQDPFPACGPPKFATKVRTSNTLLVTFQ